MKLGILDAGEWSGVAEKFRDLSYEQTVEYTEAAAARIGGQARYLVVEEGGQPAAAAALRQRNLPGLKRGIAWCPSGPLLRPRDAGAPDADRLAEILRLLRQRIVDREGHILRLRPSGLAFLPPETLAHAAHAAGLVSAAHLRPYQSVAIDLSLDDGGLKRQMNGKWRRDLNSSMQTGLEIERGKGTDLARRFQVMFEETEKMKGFQPDISPQFHYPLDGPGYRVETLIAMRNGRDVAGIVLGVCSSSATYLFGANLPEGREAKAGYLLQWEAISLSRAQGCLWYDLGGIDTEANPNVARFKIRMNGHMIDVPAWQAARPGPVSALILNLEKMRARMKQRKGG